MQDITKTILYQFWNQTNAKMGKLGMLLTQRKKNDVENPEITLNNSDSYVYSILWENIQFQ